MKKFKLLPVLLVVVLVAFSVRIADVVYRVTQIQAVGEAQAQEPQSPPVSREVFDGEFGVPDEDFSARDAFFTEEVLMDPSEVQILQDLVQRREELDGRESQIRQKEALLQAAEQQVDQKLDELKKIRDEIQKLLGQQEVKEKKRIESLVKVYEGMRPGDAANIFNELELSILIPVVENMSERKLSPILANMSPNRARIITRRLAEKVQLPKLPEDQFQRNYR